MDENKRKDIYEFFERQCSHLDTLERQREAERLTDTVLGTVEHLQDNEKCRQTDADCIRNALKKVDLALEELEGVTGAEAKHLKNELQRVKDHTGSPVQKEPTERSYIDVFADESYSVETYRRTEFAAQGDRAECMSKLWFFWIQEFGKKPGKHRGHPFFELAGIILPSKQGEKPENRAEKAFRLWLRNAQEVTK